MLLVVLLCCCCWTAAGGRTPPPAEGGSGITPVFGSGAGGGSGTVSAAAAVATITPARNAPKNAVWPLPAIPVLRFAACFCLAFARLALVLPLAVRPVCTRPLV